MPRRDEVPSYSVNLFPQSIPPAQCPSPCLPDPALQQPSPTQGPRPAPLREPALRTGCVEARHLLHQEGRPTPSTAPTLGSLSSSALMCASVTSPKKAITSRPTECRVRGDPAPSRTSTETSLGSHPIPLSLSIATPPVSSIATGSLSAPCANPSTPFAAHVESIWLGCMPSGRCSRATQTWNSRCRTLRKFTWCGDTRD